MTKVAHLSTFPEMRCGIANFAQDMIAATPAIDHAKYSLHYGSNPCRDCAAEANVNDASRLRDLAILIQQSHAELVIIQHEFGIWGGQDGEHVFEFLKNISKPIVSILHTTFAARIQSRLRERILLELIQRSRLVIVLTAMAKTSLEHLAGHSLENVLVVPHGVPDSSLASLPECDHVALTTVGFFRESKGFENVLLAIRQLVDEGMRIKYTIAGEPQRQFDGQSDYEAFIRGLVEALDLDEVVNIDARYLTVSEQIEAIHQSHLGVFAYQDPSQSSSGALPLVLSAGRAVISTPFEYAKSKAAEGFGILLSDDFGSRALARSIRKAIDTDFMKEGEHNHSKIKEAEWGAVGKIVSSYFRKLAASAP